MQSIRSQKYTFSTEAGRDALHRVFDLLLALIALLLLWPLMLLTAIAIVLESPGTCFFKQERVGRGGKIFWLLKFRTMQPDAEDRLEEVLRDDPVRMRDWEKYQKLRNDPRLTRMGYILRRFSLDELPQILNVLFGEMSFVGPRPILASQRDEYGSTFAEYIQVRPGMTGLWQVSGRNLLPFAERVRLDMQYMDNRSSLLDFTILVRTLWVVLRGEGAF